MPSDRRVRDDESRERLVALYEACYESIYAYVRRRAENDTEVPDIVAEVFAVAWRRIDAVPAPPEDRLWLFGVARRSLQRARRRAWRHGRLYARLTEEARVVPAAAIGEEPESSELLTALARLRAKEQEVLRLLLWEQLSHAEAARVLGCSVNAVALRFRKAKARLRDELTTAPMPLGRDDHSLATEPSRS